MVRAAVLTPAAFDEPTLPREPVAPGTKTVLALCALASVLLGLWLDGFAAIARALEP